jgi:hypothetical protein
LYYPEIVLTKAMIVPALMSGFIHSSPSSSRRVTGILVWIFPLTPVAAVVMKEPITTAGGDVVAEFVSILR